MNKARMLFAALSAVLLFTVVSCDNDKYQGKTEDVESMNSGRLTAYVDDAIFYMLDSVIRMYDHDYPNVKLTIEVVNARTAMSKLLAAETRISVIARDYLPDEDSLMKKFEVPLHQRMPIAQDALVIIANNEFRLDTVNSSQLTAALTQKENGLAKAFPQIEIEPHYAVGDVNSSLFANFRKMVANNKPIIRNMKYFSKPDSIIQYVIDNKYALGAIFLSDARKEIVTGKVKPLAVGFINSEGKYIRPRVYSQFDYPTGILANVVQGLYPYPVTFWAYLLEDRRNLPWWFGAYLAKEAKIQKYFKELDLVPGHAKIKLIDN